MQRLLLHEILHSIYEITKDYIKNIDAETCIYDA